MRRPFLAAAMAVLSVLVIGGCSALIAFGVFSLVGLPGAGLALVPFGVLMIMLGGIELLLSRLG